MPDKKTYRPNRLSTGLNEEHNDVFKTRAIEMRRDQSKKAPANDGVNEPAPTKPVLKATDNKKKPALAKKETTTTTTTTTNQTKRKRDDFDLDSSSDDDDKKGKKAVRKPTKPPKGKPEQVSIKESQKSQTKSSNKEIVISSDEDETSKPKPVTKVAEKPSIQKTTAPAKEEKEKIGPAVSEKEAAEKKPVAKERKAIEKKPITTEKKATEKNPTVTEKKGIEKKSTTTEKKESGTQKTQDGKRKAKSSSDDEHEEEQVLDKKRKTKANDKQTSTKSPSDPKPVAAKRKTKVSSDESDDEWGQKPSKRQDTRAKTANAAGQKKNDGKAQTKKATAAKKPAAKKPSTASTRVTQSVTSAKVANDAESTTSGSPNFKVPDVVYDHNVDISYLPMSSPEIAPKSKVPALTKETSAIAEIPTGLNELIDSQIAEIGEKKTTKKAKTTKRKRKDEDEELDLIEDIIASEGLLPDSTGARDAEQQSQIQAAMYGADYGVRTTRSKFKNVSAAKKTYGVGQRTMRKPVTEEEELEDQRLELDRARQSVASKKLKTRDAEPESPKGGKGGKNKGGKGNGKGAKGKGGKGKSGKGNGKDFDLDSDEDEGPKVASRHALLQSGKHQRILNEIDSLMEDAFRGNVVPRRSAFIDFAQIMSVNNEKGREYISKFRLNAYDAALMKDLHLEEDAITRIGCGWIMFILLNEERYSGRAVELFLSNGGFQMLKTMLNDDVDLDALVESSVFQTPLQINKYQGIVRERMLHCRFIGPFVPSSFSQRYVALMILYTILKNVNQAEGKKLILELFDPRLFVEILSPVTRFVSPPDGGRLTNFSLAVSILSHYSQSGQYYKPLEGLLESGHFTVLSNVLPTVLEWNIHEALENKESAQDFQASVLKLCIDRTNEDPATSTSIADHRDGLSLITETYTRAFKSISGNTDAQKDLDKDIDILVLTGILLSNLLEFSETARTFLRTQKSEDVLLIEALMKVFIERHTKLELAESVEETHLNVAFGYLAVALSYACREGQIRRQVRAQLGGSLNALIITMATFKAQNQALEDAEMAASQNPDEEFGLESASSNAASYTKRLEDILEELRAW